MSTGYSYWLGSDYEPWPLADAQRSLEEQCRLLFEWSICGPMITITKRRLLSGDSLSRVEGLRLKEVSVAV
jgi:uncharacterized protein YqjF (DUF2071 family)